MSRVAVVTAALNEVDAIGTLFEALARQSRLPDEVIVADGGSTDGTLDRIAELRGSLPFDVRVLIVPGKIAAGRNEAIRVSEADIVAVTDADCVPQPQWLEEIVAPVEAGIANAAAGGYVADAGTPLERAIATFTWVPLQKERQRFLPSHRSVAYRRSLWQELGGYDVAIDSGEDTLFDLGVEKLGGFANAARAVVSWRPRKSIRKAIRQQIFYGGGDGQARIQLVYHAAIAAFVCAEIASVVPVRLTQRIGLLGVAATFGFFAFKHIRLFRRAFPDLLYVAILTVVLPPARLAGFTIGLFGGSVRSLFLRS